MEGAIFGLASGLGIGTAFFAGGAVLDAVVDKYVKSMTSTLSDHWFDVAALEAEPVVRGDGFGGGAGDTNGIPDEP